MNITFVMLLMRQGSFLRWVDRKVIKLMLDFQRDAIFKRWIMNEFSLLENLVTAKINLECLNR